MRATLRLVRLIRRDEDHDVTTLRLAVPREVGVGERNVGSVHELVDEEPVPDEERGGHASRGNAIRLDQERPQKKKDRDGAEDRLDIFPNGARASPLRQGARLLSAPLV